MRKRRVSIIFGTAAFILVSWPSMSIGAGALSDTDLGRAGAALNGRRIAEPQIMTRGLPEAYQRIVRAVPFVVSKTGTGSGYVALTQDSAALVVTNHHVIENPFQDGNIAYVLLVFYDPELAKAPFDLQRVLACKTDSGAWCRAFRGSVRRAQVLGVDQDRDLSVLMVRDLPAGVERLSHAAVGAARAGEQIVVVGHPQYLLWTLTTGIISAVREQFPTESPTLTMSVIQMQAPVNPGNSGGPLTTLEGQVIGVVFSKRRGAEGLNFAIAIHEVENFVNRLAASRPRR